MNLKLLCKQHENCLHNYRRWRRALALWSPAVKVNLAFWTLFGNIWSTKEESNVIQKQKEQKAISLSGFPVLPQAVNYGVSGRHSQIITCSSPLFVFNQQTSDL